jgi:DNA repair exonuclease SbcCD ATPase subunit
MSLPPEDHVGGGVIDLLGLSLRFSIWSIMARRTAPIFFLDEPLKWLKGGGMPEKGQELISQISKQLGVQVIMVSHAPELIAGADHTVVVE